MDEKPLQIKPLSLTFRELRDVFAPLHLFDPVMVDDLHDIWKMGAPTPDSIIRDPREYDERRRQPGNFEARLILPTQLMKWILSATAKRGMPISAAQAAALLEGKVQLTW